jgi:ATP-dependent RNA circularization protein (DNA/RNA ligase family)
MRKSSRADKSMSDFFRFPHTPHIAWLAKGEPRDDKVLSAAQAQSLMSHVVVVEEKLDGANLGFSLDANGRVQAQNRGQYLQAPFAGQFARLPDWLAQAGDRLELALLGLAESPVILFGEWCAARHSLGYDHLPDWFLLFDVYDKTQGRFWSSQRRNALAETYGFVTVPCLWQGSTTFEHLKLMLKETPSRYRSGSLEGVVIRHDSQDWCEARAKLVRPDFTQAIEEHWSRRRVEWNRLVVTGN